MPIFLPNGNVNPAYLAAERKEMAAQSKRNRIATVRPPLAPAPAGPSLVRARTLAAPCAPCARTEVCVYRSWHRPGTFADPVRACSPLVRRRTSARSWSPTSSSSSLTTSARRLARSARARSTTSRASKLRALPTLKCRERAVWLGHGACESALVYRGGGGSALWASHVALGRAEAERL